MKTITKVAAGLSAFVLAALASYYLFKSKPPQDQLQRKYESAIKLIRSDAHALIRIYREKLKHAPSLDNEGSPPTTASTYRGPETELKATQVELTKMIELFSISQLSDEGKQIQFAKQFENELALAAAEISASKTEITAFSDVNEVLEPTKFTLVLSKYFELRLQNLDRVLGEKRAELHNEEFISNFKEIVNGAIEPEEIWGQVLQWLIKNQGYSSKTLPEFMVMVHQCMNTHLFDQSWFFALKAKEQMNFAQLNRTVMRYFGCDADVEEVSSNSFKFIGQISQEASSFLSMFKAAPIHSGPLMSQFEELHAAMATSELEAEAKIAPEKEVVESPKKQVVNVAVQTKKKLKFTMTEQQETPCFPEGYAILEQAAKSKPRKKLKPTASIFKRPLRPQRLEVTVQTLQTLQQQPVFELAADVSKVVSNASEAQKTDTEAAHWMRPSGFGIQEKTLEEIDEQTKQTHKSSLYTGSKGQVPGSVITNPPMVLHNQTNMLTRKSGASQVLFPEGSSERQTEELHQARYSLDQEEEEKQSEKKSVVETTGLALGMLRDIQIEVEDNMTNRELADSEIMEDDDLEAGLPKLPRPQANSDCIRGNLQVPTPIYSPQPSAGRHEQQQPEERKEDDISSSGLEITKAEGNEVVVFWSTVLCVVALMMSLVWLAMKSLQDLSIQQK